MLNRKLKRQAPWMSPSRPFRKASRSQSFLMSWPAASARRDRAAFLGRGSSWWISREKSRRVYKEIIQALKMVPFLVAHPGLAKDFKNPAVAVHVKFGLFGLTLKDFNDSSYFLGFASFVFHIPIMYWFGLVAAWSWFWWWFMLVFTSNRVWSHIFCRQCLEIQVVWEFTFSWKISNS